MDSKTNRKSRSNKSIIDLSPDPNTNELVARILDRDQQGLDNFKITMREKMLKNPRDCVFWLNNALEESIDFSRYIIEAIQSYHYLQNENEELKKEIKKLKEHNNYYMSIRNKFEKFWSGSVSFTAHENFKDLDSAIGANVRAMLLR